MNTLIVYCRFHESCLNLRERLPPRGNTPEPTSNEVPNETSLDANHTSADSDATETQKYWDYEDDDEEEDPSIPKALLPASEYDSFICGDCLINSPMLLKWAGSDGARMVIRNANEGEWYIYPTQPQGAQQDNNSTSTTEGSKKRSRDEMDGITMTSEPPTKKAKLEASIDAVPKPDLSINATTKLEQSTCTAPKPDPTIQALLDRIIERRGPYIDGPGLQGTGDIFFTAGWRERWCKCSEVGGTNHFSVMCILT